MFTKLRNRYLRKIFKLLLALAFCSTTISADDTFLHDAKNFYSKETGSTLLKGLVPAVLMAHTPMDKRVTSFYQDKIRGNATDKTAKAIKLNGDNKFLVVTYLSNITLGYFLRDTKAGMGMYNFGVNAIRSTIVGLPPLIFGQNFIGAGRPEHFKSHWTPFSNDKAISGHAYMGAVPWITLAMMVKNPILKTICYAGSTGVCFSRLNDNAHYPSQLLLAWILAYSSCNAVHRTDTYISVDGNAITVGFNF